MKIAIITIYDLNNYGNRLQNYALQTTLQKLGCDVTSLKNDPAMNKISYLFLRKLNYLRIFIMVYLKSNKKRRNNFKKFNKNIKKSLFYKNPKSKLKDKFDYFVVGSDQVWKPTKGHFRDFDLLTFANDSQKISYSASFGVDKMPEHLVSYAKNNLSKFKDISVREDAGAKIISDLSIKKEVKVLIDPTMLLTSEEWDKVSKKPKNLKSKKYILNYFLGNLSEERKNEINRIAKENDCDVINIMDKNDPMYVSGPSEFLWLEKNAFLICTDSFHSSVFSIIYNRPFVVFDREEEGRENMGSRIDTLLSKFELKDRRYNGKEITKENLNHDYSKAYEILEKEREKSDKFLRNALDIK